jgi:hypothetical protein
VIKELEPAAADGANVEHNPQRVKTGDPGSADEALID